MWVGGIFSEWWLGWISRSLMCCHCAIGEIWPFSIVVCEIAVIRFMVKTVLPVLKADFPSASRLSFFGFRTSLKAHSRRTCMGPEKIGSDCSCVVYNPRTGQLFSQKLWRSTNGYRGTRQTLGCFRPMGFFWRWNSGLIRLIRDWMEFGETDQSGWWWLEHQWIMTFQKQLRME